MRNFAFGKRLKTMSLVFISCLVIIACCLSFLDVNKLQSQRLENKSFVRQMYSAFSLSQTDLGFRIFSQWNTSPRLEQFKEGPVHLSYSSLANLPNTFIAKFTHNKFRYSDLNLGLGCLQIALCATILFYTIQFQRLTFEANPKILASMTLFLFLTNPSNLMMLIEPDVEDSFIFLLFLGCMLFHCGSVKSSKLVLCLSSFLYPLGAGALIGSFCLSKASAFLSKKVISVKVFVNNLVKNRYIPLTSGISITPLIVGFFLYFIVRLVYVFRDQSLHSNYSGSSLFTRIGLDASDHFYGGILGIFRFIIPFSGVPDGLADLVNTRALDLDDMWTLINHFQIAILYGVISMIGFVFAIATIIKNTKVVSNRNYIIPNLFLILTISVMLFLPQWSSVHFRLVSRFFAPAMSFYLGYLIYGCASRYRSIFSQAYSLAFALIFLISLDQLHFFAKWMVFTS